MKKKALLFCFCMLVNFCFAQLPANYNTETLPDTYAQPMGTIFNGDGTKMFVWTYSGQVYVSNWNGTAYEQQTTAVIDISEEVAVWRDFGLLSICLDPDFDTNGLIYLFYPVDRHHLMNFGTGSYNSSTDLYFEATISRLTRYKLNHEAIPMTTDYSSRSVLLGESPSKGVPITYESHAGSTILFGSDGTLLVTTGDGASYSTTDSGSATETYYIQALADGIIRNEENVGAFRSQMINSLNGKVLRLDPNTGDGISSNPFYDSGNPRSAASRVYAMGFRNPFRASININSGSNNPADANPGMLFVADVGWRDWEDLHIIDKPGLNAGWPLFEGQTEQNATGEDSYYFDRGTTQNADEGNQIFVSLLSQPASFVDDVNPALRRFIHSRPSISSWQATSRSRVPWFSGTTPTDPRVGQSGAPTTGIESQANSFIAGPFIVGSDFGSSMTGKFLYSDYVRNWINIATLNTTNSPWFSDISPLAPIDFGNGIVHLIQNPLDGSVFYTNILDGTIRRISYDIPLDVTSNNQSKIEVYPNPTNDFLKISNINKETSIMIFNVVGQLILSKTIIEDTEIKFSLENGVYIIKMNSESNQELVKKLIITN